MDHDFTFTPDFDGHDLEITDAHGDFIGHIAIGPDSSTIIDAAGNHISYAYHFGGVDYILDQHHSVAESVDALGTVHDAEGVVFGHFYENNLGTGPELLDQQNRIVATVLARMAPQ